MTDAHAVGNSVDHTHPHPNYMGVFWLLLILTILEVVVTLPFVGLSDGLQIPILVIMAFVKAAMVALYFMHLKYDHKVLTVIAVVPVVLVAIAIGVLSYEYTHYTISESAKTLPPQTGEPAE